jgi:predicted ATPase
LERAVELLREQSVRLLTVTGPGGIGKTRFTLQIAHELRDWLADGIAYVDLTPVRDPTLVPQTIALVLGLREQPERAFDTQLRGFLQGKHFLLILDNLEQVLEAAHFVADLLANCPGLRVVAASRAPLHVRAEHQLLLAPLSREAASDLFRERALRQGVRLERHSSTSHMVAAICEQVDKIPLAIELAAAHVRVLSLSSLLERLEDRLGLLRGGDRDLPERQRAMEEAIAWSYNLLDTTAQHTFRALSVFVGGCTLVAAEAVCSSEESSPNNVLSRIAALVDASLVRVEVTVEGPPRYIMFEVIREYALDELHGSGEEEQYRQRHAEYYARLAEAAGRDGGGQGSDEANLEQESSNVRAALHWAYERRKVALGLRLVTSFGPIWFRHGQIGEAGLWLEKMLELDAAAEGGETSPVVRGRALHAASRHAMTFGQFDRAEALAKKALELAERTGEHIDRSRALAVLGSTALAAGREAEADILFTESYVAARWAGEARSVGLALLNLSEVARRQGDFQRATQLLEESLVLMRATHMTWAIADTVTLLGHLARQQGDYERAKLRYRESLELYRELDPTHTAWCLEGIAAMAYSERQYERTTRLCAAAAALRASAHTPPPPSEQEDVDRIVMTARAELGENSFTDEWRAGSTMTHEEAISYALSGFAD